MTSPLQESSNFYEKHDYSHSLVDKLAPLISNSPLNIHNLFEFSSPSVQTYPPFTQKTTLGDAVTPKPHEALVSPVLSSLERHKISSTNMIYSSPVVNSLPQSAQILSTALLNNSTHSPNKPDIAELLTPSRRIQVAACVSEPIASFQQYLGVNFHPKSEQILRILKEYSHARNVKSSEEALYNGVAMCFMEQVFLTETSELLNSALLTLFTSEEWAHTEFYGFFAYVKNFLQNPINKDIGFYEAIVRDYKLYAKGLSAFREVMYKILCELDTEKKRNPSELFNWLNEYDFLTQEILSKLAHLLHCKIRILIISHLSFMEETFFFAENPENIVAANASLKNSNEVREYAVLYDITADKSYLLYNDDNPEEEKKHLETILEAHETVETPTDIENDNYWINLQALNWLRGASLKQQQQQQNHQILLENPILDKENFSPSLKIGQLSESVHMKGQKVSIGPNDINSEQITVFQGLMDKYRKVKDQIEEISGDLQKFDLGSEAYGSLETRNLNGNSVEPKGLNPLLSSLLHGFVYQNELLKVQLDQLTQTIHELREKGTAKHVVGIIGAVKPAVEHEKVRSKQTSVMQSFMSKNELAKVRIEEIYSVLARLEDQKLSSNFDSQGVMSSPGNTEMIKAKLQELEGNYGDFSEQRIYTESDFAGNPSGVTDAQILLSQKTESEALLEEEKMNSVLELRRPRISVEARMPSLLNYDAPISAPMQTTDFSARVEPFAKLATVASASLNGTHIYYSELDQEEYSKAGEQLLNSRNSGTEGLEPKGAQQTPKHGPTSEGEVPPPIFDLQGSPIKQYKHENNLEMLEKAEKWLQFYKTPEKSFYMHTEVQTPNRQFYSRGLAAELDISKRRSNCRSTSPKKAPNQIREAIAILPLNLKMTFDEMSKKLDKHNPEFDFMVNKRVTESQIENKDGEKTFLGDIFDKYKEIMENKKKVTL